MSSILDKEVLENHNERQDFPVCNTCPSETKNVKDMQVENTWSLELFSVTLVNLNMLKHLLILLKFSWKPEKCKEVIKEIARELPVKLATKFDNFGSEDFVCRPPKHKEEKKGF